MLSDTGAGKQAKMRTWALARQLVAPTSEHHWRAISEVWTDWLKDLDLRTALEIGCGEPPFLLLRLLREQGIEATGFDCKPYPSCDVGDSHDLPYENGSFDLVIARHHLEHVLSPYEVLAEMARVSRFWLLVIVPYNSAKSLRWPDHLWHLTDAGWRRLFENLGLKVTAYHLGDHTEQHALDNRLWQDLEHRYLLAKP